MVSNNQKLHLDYSEHKHNTKAEASAIAGKPAATRCTRNSMDTSQDFMQGTNNNMNVAKSRDASSSKVRQKQRGHNPKQGLHAGNQQQHERRQQQQVAPETAWTQVKTETLCREPTAAWASPTAGMPAAAWWARNRMDTSQNKDFMQGAISNMNVGNSRDASSNMVRQKQHGRSQAKTGTSCREPTALRTSAIAGMPAATWCARNSMDTSKNKDSMQGANSNKNVSNSRDASSNKMRQKQHGHNLKQGLHAGSQQH
jgi:hypothetical protein